MADQPLKLPINGVPLEQGISIGDCEFYASIYAKHIAVTGTGFGVKLNGINYRSLSLAFKPTASWPKEYNHFVYKGDIWSLSFENISLGGGRTPGGTYSALKKFSKHPCIQWFGDWINKNPIIVTLSQEAKKGEVETQRKTLIAWMTVLEERLDKARDLLQRSLKGEDVSGSEYLSTTAALYRPTIIES